MSQAFTVANPARPVHGVSKVSAIPVHHGAHAQTDYAKCIRIPARSFHVELKSAINMAANGCRICAQNGMLMPSHIGFLNLANKD